MGGGGEVKVHLYILEETVPVVCVISRLFKRLEVEILLPR